MDYKINLGAWTSVFAVPSAVVDKYILLASGSAIKVLLFVLRNCDKELSTNDIAINLKLSEETVSDAINFWIQAGLLTDNEGVLEPNTEQSEVAKPLSFVAKVENKAVNVRKVDERKVGELSPSEIAERIEGSDEIKALFKTASMILGKPLNYTDQRTLLRITDYIGMNADIVIILLRYCKSIDKCNMRYVESVATAWVEEGIKTHNDADKKIAALKRKNKLASKIKTAFGIERNLSKTENEYIETWSVSYKMSFDMILAAYEIMCKNVSKISFAYINKILSNWNDEGIHTVDKISESKKFKKVDNDDASYDLDEFEKMALKTTPKGASND